MKEKSFADILNEEIDKMTKKNQKAKENSSK